MSSVPAYYNGFNLNDGVHFFLTSKSFDMVPTQLALSKIARIEGMKKTGQTINEKNISLTVRVVGTSRSSGSSSLESLLDQLYAALAVQQGKLQIHGLDNRYYVCDCVSATTSKLGVIYADVAIQFTAQIPYALAATASSFTSGTISPVSQSGNTYVYDSIVFPGGGNIFSRPSMVITNQSAVNTIALAAPLVAGTNVTNITVQLPHTFFNLFDTFKIGADEFMVNAHVAITDTVIPVLNVNFGTFVPTTAHGIGSVATQDISWSSLQIAQDTDALTFQSNDAIHLPKIAGDLLTIVGDPTTATGLGVWDGANNPVEFAGVIPWQEPNPTSWTITIFANSLPFLTIYWSWTPRWLS